MTAPAEPPRFDLSGPLPGPGTTVLEASAGTGKTYALTSLVARYVASGVPLSQILAVTFTRMATGELRDRIRERLVEVHAGLESAVESPDPVTGALRSAPVPEVRRRAGRLADAVSEFDSATIATTHGFCHTVLRELGSAGDIAPEVELLEDPTDLVDEVVGDLYLRWALGRPALPFSPEVARTAAAMAVRNPDTEVVPGSGEDPSGLLGRLALRARQEVARRLLDRNLLTYDNLLHQLARTLADPVRGPAACRRLRRRYRVVLVDEFQDTDPSQWQILRLAFGAADTALVLIGDPKQAVYGFRGADVYAYLDAARSADHCYTLSDNWRADQPLLDATDAVLSPLQFGHEGIPYRPVRAAADRQEPGLRGHPRPAPLRFRVVADRQPGVRTTFRGQLQKGSLMEWVAADVADDVSALLASGATLEAGDPDRPIAPGDVAVLTRTNRQALMVRQALQQAGVASVVAGMDTVFASPAARDWLRLLEALQEPSSRSRVAAVALTSFMGMTADDVAASDEDGWERAHDRVQRWASTLSGRGVAALYRAVTVEEGLSARVLGREGGERLLTDLAHVAHLLHAEAAAGQLAAPALRAWLAARIQAAATEQGQAEERSRRLESDAEAVQVLTIHRAKGLEFPVVYCPYLWDPGRTEGRSAPVVFHDPGPGDVRTLDVGCPAEDRAGRSRYDRHAGLARAERRGEDLRLLYVALTRARHQVVVWWASARDSRQSPLGRLLVCRDAATGRVGPVPAGEPSARVITASLETLSRRAPGLIGVESPGPLRRPAPGASLPEGAVPAGADLHAARFDRELDLRWRRASYTGLTAAAHHPAGTETVGSEPEDRVVADEPVEPVERVGASGPARGGPGPGAPGPPLPGPAGPRADRPSPMAGIPAGAGTGTFVHRVLECTDFSAGNLGAEIDSALARAAGPSSGPVEPLDELRTGLLAALTTPLDPLLAGMSLSALARNDRLDELSFELPVAGGDDPSGQVRMADIAQLVGAHLPTAGSGRPLAGYADRLAAPELATTLRGYLTGSLDLVFRVAGPDGTHRWYLADYKTNRLGDPDRVLALGDYRLAAMDAEMQRRHYPLQALLYLVALHRYLRWRQAGYSPERDLGGVLYLFLRGMGGPDTPVVDGTTCGVYPWSPPAQLVVALSDLLDGGAR